MLLSKRNQLFNVKNSAQGITKKVLCVCSAGLLRSPTLSSIIHNEYGLNTRSCGTSKEYALIPITEALIVWAELIIFVNKENYLQLDSEELALISELGTPVKWLNIEDNYEWNSPELVKAIKDSLHILEL